MSIPIMNGALKIAFKVVIVPANEATLAIQVSVDLSNVSVEIVVDPIPWNEAGVDVIWSSAKDIKSANAVVVVC